MCSTWNIFFVSYYNQLVMINLNQYKRLDARNKCIDPLVGAAAIGAGAGLLSGFGNLLSGNSANKTNYKIMKEQNKFNAEEAKKQRDWQESMYNRYESASAQSAQYRAAGLNSQLMGIQNGSVGQGSSASAAESAQMNPLDMGFVGQAAKTGVDMYSELQNAKLQESQEDVNKSIEALNKANTMKARNESENTFYINRLLEKSLHLKIDQEYLRTSIMRFENTSAEYQAAKMKFEALEMSPARLDNMVASTYQFMAGAYKDVADGKLTYKKCEDIVKQWGYKQLQLDLEAERNDIMKESNEIQKDLNNSIIRHNDALTAVEYQKLWEMKKWNPRLYTKQIQNLGKQGLQIDANIELMGSMATFYESGAFRNYAGTTLFGGEVGYDMYQDMYGTKDPITERMERTKERFNRAGEFTGSETTKQTRTKPRTNKKTGKGFGRSRARGRRR